MKLQPIGWIRSTLRDVAAAPKQGSEGAPDAWLEVDATFAHALAGLKASDAQVMAKMNIESLADLVRLADLLSSANPPR